MSLNYFELPDLWQVLMVFSFWALIEVMGLLYLVLIVKGIGLWEKSKNHSTHNAYLVGIMFLLYTLVMDTILLLARKSGSIVAWDLTNWTHYSWYMPIFWFYIATLASAYMACLYLSPTYNFSIKDTRHNSGSNRGIFSTNPRKVALLGILAGILALWLTIVALVGFISYRSPFTLIESINLWVFAGALVLSLFLIFNGTAKWEKSKNDSVRYAYLVSAIYLLLTIIIAFNALKFRGSLPSEFIRLKKSDHTPLEYWLSIRLLFIPTYWIIFAVIVCIFLLLLFYKTSIKNKESQVYKVLDRVKIHIPNWKELTLGLEEILLFLASIIFILGFYLITNLIMFGFLE